MTLFASTDLAARIERAEGALCAEAVRQRIARGVPQAFVRDLAGGLAVYAGGESPFNKVAGLGFGGPVAESALAEVESAYAGQGAAVRVELSSLGEPSVGLLLSRRGYALQGFENVLARALPVEPAAERLDVQVLESTQMPLWLETVVEGFAHPDEQGMPSDESFPRAELETAITDMAASEGFVRYLAYRRGSVAGAASLRLSSGIAQLCGASTLPQHRRRGVQSALLAARLEAAARAGCELAVMTTQPGSRSQQNAQKLGFALLYTRAVLVKEPPAATSR